MLISRFTTKVNNKLQQLKIKCNQELLTFGILNN
jgi:hypothetical protein